MALPSAGLLPGLLLVTDALTLVLLVPLVPVLASLGIAGVWLEAALRLPVLAVATWLLPRRGPSRATAAAVTVAITPAAFGTLRVLFSGCRGAFFLLLKARLHRILSLRLFSHVVHQDLDFFQGVSAAELLAQFSVEVPRVCETAPKGANQLFRSLGMALVVGAFMVGLAPGLALLALLELPLGIANHRIQSARKRVRNTRGKEWEGDTEAGMVDLRWWPGE
ncbi:hypothetical protein DUI87_35277 [Hirundo rustica rustica]|uniref:ABC transmembrane type-1 domain-containing protein n=1 Tax=Hirundo rustica rustica TaxID=333673 RepID=A0A3M0IHV1_HIRRU|nr:hypothetical protein DUI87_35277 [Hirundo rustica rustica]